MAVDEASHGVRLPCGAVRSGAPPACSKRAASRPASTRSARVSGEWTRNSMGIRLNGRHGLRHRSPLPRRHCFTLAGPPSPAGRSTLIRDVPEPGARHHSRGSGSDLRSGPIPARPEPAHPAKRGWREMPRGRPDATAKPARIAVLSRPGGNGLPVVGADFRPGWPEAGEERAPARTPANEAASGAHSRMPQWPGKPEGTVSTPADSGVRRSRPRSKSRPKWNRA